MSTTEFNVFYYYCSTFFTFVKKNCKSISAPQEKSKNSKNLKKAFPLFIFLCYNRVMQKVMHNFVNGTKTRRFSIAKNKCIRLAGCTASILFVFLLATSIFPIFLKDDSASGAPSPVESTTTLAMTSNYETASVDLVPSSSNGTFTSSPADKQARFGITTTNYTGYTVTIESSNDDGLLTNENTGDTLASITSTTSEADFSANTTEAATNYNGKWGYMPSKFNTSTSSYDSLSSGNYLPSPTTIPTTIDTTTIANTTTNEYAITLGARADYQKPSGTYSKTFTLNAVGNPVAYAINYIDNSSGTETTLGTQSSAVATTDVVIDSGLTPTRVGYTFSSWCDVATTVSADGSTSCSGNTYTEGDDFNFIDQTSALSTAGLYAVWTINTYEITYGTVTGIASVSLNGTACSTALSSGGCKTNLAYNQTYNLTSVVNTDNYNFNRWAAGSYGSVASATNKSTTYTVGAGASTITPSVASCTALSGYMQSFAPTSAYCTTGKLTDRRDNQIYTIAKINGKYWMTRNLAIGCAGSGSTYSGSYSAKTLTSTYSNVSAQYTTSTTAVTTSGAQNKTSCSSTYGAWYDRAAATAGTQVVTTSSSTYDICPSKWKLPSKTQVDSITNSQEYYELFKPVKGGSYSPSTLDNTFSLWWSSDPYSSGSSSVYALVWSYGYNYLTHTGPNPSRGNYVRCILK